MAQWIPKTNWKLSNLNKMYGVGEIGLHTPPSATTKPKARSPYQPGVQQATPFFASSYRPVPAVFSQQQNQQKQNQKETEKYFSETQQLLKQAYDAHVPFIDLRDPHESNKFPLKKALIFHHHDLLSGACNEILPEDRQNAQIVVFASTQQRVLNGYKALKRWGFENVVVTNVETVQSFDN